MIGRWEHGNGDCGNVRLRLSVVTKMLVAVTLKTARMVMS